MTTLPFKQSVQWLAAVALLFITCVWAGAAENTVVVTDFSQATVGSNMSQSDKHILCGWTAMGASAIDPNAAVVINSAIGGTAKPALQLGKGAGMMRTVDLSVAKGGKMVIIRYRFADTADNDWFGLFVRNGEGSDEPYRLQTNPGTNDGKGALILRKKNTELFSKAVLLVGPHELELRITCAPAKNTLAILLDSELIGTAEDSGQDGSPVIPIAEHTNIVFSNFNNEATAKTIIHDISIKIRSVPASGEEKDTPTP